MSVRQRSNEKRGVMSSRRVLLATLLALLNALPVFATGPSFVADATLKGSSLSGWHTVGAAKWSLDHSVLTGTPGSSGDGGWLVLDRSYQDIGLYAEFKCSGACDAGILFRGEKTPDGGMKGSYVSLNGETLTYYAVTVDANGKIIERTPLPRGGGRDENRAPAQSEWNKTGLPSAGQL